MESRATTTESNHSYPSSTPWASNPTPSSAATSTTLNPVSLPDSSASNRYPAPIDFLPFLFPQQASLYQAQLLHYTNLISPGRGGGLQQQSQPLPPPVHSAPHTQSGPRSRSSSKVSNKEYPVHKGNQAGHGNRAVSNTDKGDRAVVTAKEAPPKMPPKQAELSHPLPARPARPPHPGQTHSSSVPSTPHQHARNFSFESREPSPNATTNHSPRSAYSETNSALPSLRPLPPRLGGCQYETAQVNSRRRMPYSLGGDRLDASDLGKIKNKLSEEHERKLTTDMRELYDRLLPTQEVEKNRRKLVLKLEKLFNDEWPEHNIRVHLFGSSGNLLCSDDSDVDICITTPWQELEGVCMIAELLARQGMEKVVCISAAKVPIVKIWDPELGLACDMNVNNTLALENTRMVRTYVEIDPRVRQLAMIIKYWTRRRIVNDAAFGGTLSSYTWICMIIAFLQLRDPPILPALHQRQQQQKPPKRGGSDSPFADDLDKLRGFGGKNKSSLGELLFQFFRFYAHEFQYDKHALSVRSGKKLSKQEKGWHFSLNNQLCVEEPFNTGRNLGNTADDTSFRGLHLELRRAFDLISEAKLEACCEQYIFPKEEERTWTRPPQASRPLMIRSSSQQHGGRGGRGNYRGRHSNNFHRNGNSNRRASSSVAYDTNTMFMPPVTMTPQELAWYSQQAQAQQPQLQYPALVSAAMALQHQQESNIRIQLYNQSQVYAQFQAQLNAQLHAQQRMQGTSTAQQGSNRSRTNSFDAPPLSAPLSQPEWFMYGIPVNPQQYVPPPSFAGTFPSSPAAPASATSEFRRSMQRSTAGTDSSNSAPGSSLRSQSQPASRPTISEQYAQAQAHTPPLSNQWARGPEPFPGAPSSTASSVYAPSFAAPRNVNGVQIPSFIPDDADYDETPQPPPVSHSPASEDGAYIGYYVAETASPGRRAQGPNGIAFGDLHQSAQNRRRLSTDQLPQSILDRRMRRTSRSPSPLGHARAFSVGTSSAPLTSGPFPVSNGARIASRPLVVNGTGSSLRTSSTPSQRQPSAASTATADSVASDDATSSLYDNPLQIQGYGFSSYPADRSAIPPTAMSDGGRTPIAERPPMIVNGTTSAAAAPAPPLQPAAEDASFRDRIALMQMNPHYFSPHNAFQSDLANGSQSPSARTRVLTKQQQSGVIAPLDLAIRDQSRPGEHPFVTDLAHLSPVYETRTPSPTAVRKFDAPARGDKAAAHQTPSKEARADVSKQPPKAGDSRMSATKDMKQALAQSQSRHQPTSAPQGRAPAQQPQQPQQQAQGSNQAQAPQPKANGSKENGHVRGAKSESHNADGGWQKATKNRKKGADGKNQTNGFVQSEQLPKHESDRKGG